jgi:vacuolar-type H+-ATPase subunit C/Vma6
VEVWANKDEKNVRGYVNYIKKGHSTVMETELFDKWYSKFLQGWKHTKPELLASLGQIQKDVKLARPLKKK